MALFHLNIHSDHTNEPHWHPFTVGQDHYDPNKWTITRTNGICSIETEQGWLIDEPDDVGQSNDALIVHGIIWVISHAVCINLSTKLRN